MNVGIIGTANRDKLILPSGARVESWGGVIYNILTLSHYMGPDERVRPICPLGANAKDVFLDLLNRFSNVDAGAIFHCPEPHNRVTLECISQEEKRESAQLTLPPLPFDHIKQHLSELDFLLINFTSGREIEKDTLRQIRDFFKGPILLDVHSLTLGDPDVKGRRRPQVLRDWQEWLKGVDYVQLTMYEAGCMTGESSASISNLVDVADWLLMNGTKGIFVTRGEDGAYYFHTDDDGILKEEIPPFTLHTVVDTTGCGDVFSSALIYHYLKRNDILKALEFAVKASALKATTSGIQAWLK
ncbi:hypothetical protein CEE37_13870 [candidate division LCP-89 bacterium B3_LCP]|uniref:Carbohydrate kinase PfkB domain-containing protein n=1 Tax=candidate division LCP-89 bacterium B3_LCP TaxID=2012998 RepID=A0A532URL0_UNCL8|nr:MAG: hypothetical protein CEE37_13870 [candidate division LCP-89 bacterium B3_LCP]